MQMGVDRSGPVVDHPHYTVYTLLLLDRGTRRGSVVANKGGWAVAILVDLAGELVHHKFVVGHAIDNPAEIPS